VKGDKRVRSSSLLQAAKSANEAGLDPTVMAYALSYALEATIGVERHVKLFKNGRSQAVRIPREFELPGNEAVMRKEGERLIIEAAPPRSLRALLASLQPIEEDFPRIEDPAPEPLDL
jgi:antitoxin VapB